MTPDRAAELCAPLVTARLALEPLTGEHAAALFPILHDPGTQRWISAPKARTPAELEERWTGLQHRVSPDHTEAWLGWAARRRDTGEYVGKLDAAVGDDDRAPNVGYVFAPAHWGQGLATEAVRAVVEHLVACGVRELRATVTVGNDASCRVLERVGFRHAGVLPGNDVIRGVAHDDHLYILWAPVRPALRT